MKDLIVSPLMVMSVIVPLVVSGLIPVPQVVGLLVISLWGFLGILTGVFCVDEL